jgi:NAD(P)-dependent dehydrogenase (short-subunit alcohol dehydrogenase family)
MGKLQGKVALITGGTSGIGLAAAKLFVAEGAFVFLTGRRQSHIDDAIQSIGVNALGIQGDISRLPDLDRLCDAIRSTGKRIDIVFANAGVGGYADLGSISEDHFDLLFGTNVKGTLFTVQKILPLMNDGGSVVLTCSAASSKGTRGLTVYGATRAAVRSFVRTWTVELKERRIRTNVVSPGPIDTPAAGQAPAEALAKLVSTIPMGRMGRAEEVARAALFLASDEASFISGIELFVDGGRAQI